MKKGNRKKNKVMMRRMGLLMLTGETNIRTGRGLNSGPREGWKRHPFLRNKKDTADDLTRLWEEIGVGEGHAQIIICYCAI